MKIIKYPKWKKKCICRTCGTEFIIKPKDIAKKKINVVNYPIDNHKALPYCPFCSEKLEIDIQEFYNKKEQ